MSTEKKLFWAFLFAVAVIFGAVHVLRALNVAVLIHVSAPAVETRGQEEAILRALPRRSAIISTPRAESAAQIKTAKRSATRAAWNNFFTLDATTVVSRQTCGPARAFGGGRVAGPQTVSRA